MRPPNEEHRAGKETGNTGGTVFSAARLFDAFKEADDQGTVNRSGKIFEAGDYPDKAAQFDEADLDRVVETFQPVENDLEHAATLLDGKLGKLERVWKKGAELFGTVSVPKWLDRLIGREPIKVSLAFDRDKRIVGHSLVVRPRIPDAAIMAAFSAAHPSSVTNAPGSGNAEPPKRKAMKLKEAIKHLFGLDRVDDLDAEVTLPEAVAAAPSPTIEPEPSPAPTPAPAFTGGDPERKAMEERLRTMEARFSAMAETALRERSLAFADQVIRNKKAVPAQRDHIAAVFCFAAKADAGTGPVFSAESGVTEGPHLEQLKKLFEAAPTHAFSGEAIPDGAALFFGSKVSDDGMDQNRKAKLLGMTGLGKAALKEPATN